MRDWKSKKGVSNDENGVPTKQGNTKTNKCQNSEKN